MISQSQILAIILAFLPSTILFGPILSLFLKEAKRNTKLIAISGLRDFFHTKRPFLFWVNLYMFIQMVYVFFALNMLIKIPLAVYVLNISSLISGVIAFIFLSSSLKHMFLIGVAFLLSVISLVVASFLLIQTDLLFGVYTIVTAVAVIGSLGVTPFQKKEIYFGEYIALSAISLWNFVLLSKILWS